MKKYSFLGQEFDSLEETIKFCLSKDENIYSINCDIEELNKVLIDVSKQNYEEINKKFFGNVAKSKTYSAKKLKIIYPAYEVLAEQSLEEFFRGLLWKAKFDINKNELYIFSMLSKDVYGVFNLKKVATFKDFKAKLFKIAKDIIVKNGLKTSYNINNEEDKLEIERITKEIQESIKLDNSKNSFSDVLDTKVFDEFKEFIEDYDDFKKQLDDDLKDEIVKE